MKVLAVIILLAFSIQCVAQSIIESTKSKIKTMECLTRKTETMCFIESMAKIDPVEDMETKKAVYGKSNTYYLVSKKSTWLKVKLNSKRTEDLVLVESESLAFIQADIEKGKSKNFKKSAKKPLKKLLKKLNAEPDVVEAGFPPWSKNGVIYQVCYNTAKKTVECMISAAANLPSGHVTIFSISSDTNDIVDSVVQIIASLDEQKAK